MMTPHALRKLFGRPDPAGPPPAPGRLAAPGRRPILPGPPAPPALSAAADAPATTRSAAPAERLPVLTVSAPALAALRWSARRSADECCFWGVLETSSAGLRLAEAVLARHQGSPAYSIPDMDDYADLVAERHESGGLQPWQLACWIHTHPAGLDRPSGVDRATFTRHFGRQRLAVMLIMTHDLLFCGELSACLPALDGLPPARLASPLQISFEDPRAEASAAEAARLGQQHAERVTPLAGGWGGGGARDQQSWWLELGEDDEPEDELQDADGSWPAGWGEGPDPDWFGRPGRREPTLPGEVSRRELESYALGFLTIEASGRAAFDPALLELELIAAGLGGPGEMTVRAAAALRQRLRALDPQTLLNEDQA